MSYAKAPRLRFAARYGLPVVLAVGLVTSVQLGWWGGEEAAEAVPFTKRAPLLHSQLSEPDLPAESGNDLSDHALTLSVASPREAAEQQNSPPLTEVTEASSTGISALPADALELVKIAVAETIAKNHTSAALALLDAIELSSDNPKTHEYMHQLAGWNYEQAGLVDFAIEQYQHALAINPVQRNSHQGLRRLDLEFRASHDALPDRRPPEKIAARDKPKSQSNQ